MTQSPLLDPSETIPTNKIERTRTSLDEERDEIRLAFHALNHGSDMITRDQPKPDEPPCPAEEPLDSQKTAVSSSIFDSQLLDDVEDKLPQVDGTYDTTSIVRSQERDRDRRARHALRREARDAALRALWQDERRHWDDLNLRSVGRAGHTEIEIEL